jgi:hypothetical protein
MDVGGRDLVGKFCTYSGNEKGRRKAGLEEFTKLY